MLSYRLGYRQVQFPHSSKVQVPVSKSPSTLSIHATYKRLVDITKGKDDSSRLAIIKWSAFMRNTSLDKVIGQIEPIGPLLWTAKQNSQALQT